MRKNQCKVSNDQLASFNENYNETFSFKDCDQWSKNRGGTSLAGKDIRFSIAK